MPDLELETVRDDAGTDLSLAIQRALHPPSDIDPNDVGEVYDRLYDYVERAVNREGLL